MKLNRFPFFAASATLLIIVAVIFPGNAIPDLPVEWFGIDKIAHLIMFLSWAVALHADFRIVSVKDVFTAFAACVLFSLFTEALQLFAEGRSFDLFDALFDLIGFSVGILFRSFLSRPLAARGKKGPE